MHRCPKGFTALGLGCPTLSSRPHPRQGELVSELMRKHNNCCSAKPSASKTDTELELLRSPMAAQGEREGKGGCWCLGGPIISELQTALLTWEEN